MENRVWVAETNPTMRTKPTADYPESEQALSGRHASAIRSTSSFTIARVRWQTREKTSKTLVMGLLPELLVQDRYSLGASSNRLQQCPFAARQVAVSWQSPCRASGRRRHLDSLPDKRSYACRGCGVSKRLPQLAPNCGILLLGPGPRNFKSLRSPAKGGVRLPAGHRLALSGWQESDKGL
jgi:hypothetical protein